MSKEVLVVCCNRDAVGMTVIDPFNGGVPICPQFKGCIVDTGSGAAGSSLCCIGGGVSSYEDIGGCGDYLAVAQANKPMISLWHWGKPQCHMNCHIQEIATAMCTTSSGAYLFAGTAKGWIYIWEVSTGHLLNSFQAHYKAVRQMRVPCSDNCLISVAEDGMGRQWMLHKLLDINEMTKTNQRNIKPNRTWSCHTLPITDMLLVDAAGVSGCSLRIWTSSLDRTVVLFDPFAGKQCARLTMPQSITAIAMNQTCDILVAGSTDGPIYIIDLNEIGKNYSTANTQRQPSQSFTRSSGGSSSTGDIGQILGGSAFPAHGNQVLVGHQKNISGLCFSRGFNTQDVNCLISSSIDGYIRIWNIWTRQCINQFQPLNKCAITNIMLIKRPTVLSRSSTTKPTLHPLNSLKKYPNDLADCKDSSSIMLGPCLLPNLITSADEVPLRTRLIISPSLLGKRRSVGYGERDEEENVSNAVTDTTPDFIQLPSADSSFLQPASGKTIQDLNDEIQRLKDENARWEKVCTQMKQMIEQTATPS